MIYVPGGLAPSNGSTGVRRLNDITQATDSEFESIRWPASKQFVNGNQHFTIVWLFPMNFSCISFWSRCQHAIIMIIPPFARSSSPQQSVNQEQNLRPEWPSLSLNHQMRLDASSRRHTHLTISRKLNNTLLIADTLQSLNSTNAMQIISNENFLNGMIFNEK